jgi:hypothetical protein
MTAAARREQEIRAMVERLRAERGPNEATTK